MGCLNDFLGSTLGSCASYNFGDELNLDIAGALLGLSPRCHSDEASCGESSSTVSLTLNNSETGKMLMIGSTLRCARTSDVVFGAGIKPPITVEMLAALRGNRISVFGVRGPRTCEAIRGTKHYFPPSCPVYGDPALFVHMLVPEWSLLRRAPSSAAKAGGSQRRTRRPSGRQTRCWQGAASQAT